MIQTFKRHWQFFGIVFCYVTAEAVVRATSLIMENESRGTPIETWKPFALEFSSTYVAFILFPIILMFDERYPIASRKWPLRVLCHIPMSMLFSLLHISGFVALRKLIYRLAGDVYTFTDLSYAIPYEYRKDLMSYIAVMVVIYGYREILRLRHGEAQIEQSEEERIMVSKSGVFKFIDPFDVDWVEAAGNYVELHVGEETFMLRATMKEIENRLGTKDFARIHRSTIIRRNFMDRVKPAMNGDKLIYLKDGTELRLSRRYNDNLKLAG